MSRTEPTASPESLRILAADLSLRCPSFAILRWEDDKASVERLCHLGIIAIPEPPTASF